MALSAIVDWRRPNPRPIPAPIWALTSPAIHSTSGPRHFLIAACGVRQSSGRCVHGDRTRLVRMALSSSAHFRFSSATFGATVPFHNSECAGLWTCEALGTDMGPTTCLGDLPGLSAISIGTAANMQYIDVGPDDALCARRPLWVDRLRQGINYSPGRHSGAGDVVCPANNRNCLAINRSLTPIRSRYLAPLRRAHAIRSG